MASLPATTETSFRREILAALLRGTLFWHVAYFVLGYFFAVNRTGAMWAGLASTLFILLLPAWLLRRGSVSAGAICFVVNANLMFVVVGFLSHGIRSLAVVYQLAFTVIALILLGARAAVAVALFAILSDFGLALYEALGFPSPHYFPVPPLNTWMLASFCFVLAAVPLRLSLIRLRQALHQSETQAEERQRAQERILYQGQLIAQAADPMIAVNAQNVITFWNAAAARMLGYSEQEALGAGLDSIVRLSDISAFSGLQQELDAHGRWSGELDVPTRHHGTIPVEAAVSRLHDETGRRIGSVGAFRDIRQRKWAENELREREARLALTFDRAPVAMFEAGFDGTFLRVNGAFAALVGEDKDQLAGRFLLDLLHPDDRAAESGAFQSVATGATPSQSHGRRLCHRDGSTLWVNSHLALVTDGAARPLCVMGTVEDITQRHIAEQERQQMQDQLLQAQKMQAMGRLAGGVAHDFNNLLTLINGYSHLILDALPADDALRQPLGEIAGAGQRAAALVQQLLAFSRRQVQSREVLDLNEVLEGSRRMLSPLLGAGIDISFTFSGSPARVEADRHQLEQVILNLAVNARDAMPRGGLLLFGIEKVPAAAACPHCGRTLPPVEYVELHTRDTGIGMDAATLAQAFEPFFTTKRSGEGTGLGLPTIQGIVEQSGGHVCAQSAPSAGSEFFVLLPATSREPAPVRDAPAPPPPPAGSGESVLVVEDERPVREFIATVLQEYGYCVHLAADASAGLDLLRTQSVDLLVTDIAMPGQNGVELAREAQSLHPDLPVLFISGNAQERLETPSGAPPASSFLPKPFTPQVLAARVGQALSRARRGGWILVVDDEEPIRTLFRQVLEKAGHRVLEAGDGKQALARMARQPVDLVITDLIMPEQEGIETICKLRKTYPALGIIAATGSHWSRFLAMARALGADATLTKPVSPDTLVSEVERVLALRR